uniref:Reverse transcriptase domain-containing protein n=1 Tax=Fagus sylvatica TaxID=28930 RepID=A0A2N9EM59_FAGSY
MESWDLLRKLGNESLLPWMICGDFNEIVDNGEKLGFRSRPQRQMRIFREALSDCRLEDLGYQGPKFTWCNMQNNEDVVFARLDRGVCTREWLQLFPSAKVRIIPFVFSDHHVVIVDCLRTTPNPSQRKHQFRFEAMWIKRENCEEVIRSAWAHPQHGTKMFCLCQKIKACRVALLQWSKQGIFSLPRTIKALKANLCDIDINIQENWQDHARLAERNGIRKELNHLISQEEIYWRQRSRISWMKDGDRNTKFFHECASQRKRKNEISRLRNQYGDWVLDKTEMEGMVNNYFNNLFTSSNPVGIPNVVSLVDRVVSDDMNQRLVRDFDAEEVRRALFQIHPTKAPGPDGMSAIFFQNFWHIVGEDFTNAILDYLNTGRMLSSVNLTHIVMIPKTKSPENLTQFCPISLCNVIYKTISKVLANRLKSILPSIISESQSAFVPGRLISDNILVAFEILHYMKNKHKGKSTHMATKLDMSKAYDRVEWGYLEAMMVRMGFHERWVSLIMNCLSSVQYAVLFNGCPTEAFFPSRGIRQGDPLSPYLFLLCAEGLMALLRKADLDFSLRGVAVCRNGPRVTHLMFADDCLLFFRANIEECQVVTDILSQYEEASGQKLNNDKTSIFYSSNTPHDTRVAIGNLLGAPNSNSIERYLGLPPFLGRSKIKAFEDLPAKVWKKLQGWKEKLLSQAGKEI